MQSSLLFKKRDDLGTTGRSFCEALLRLVDGHKTAKPGDRHCAVNIVMRPRVGKSHDLVELLFGLLDVPGPLMHSSNHSENGGMSFLDVVWFAGLLIHILQA